MEEEGLVFYCFRSIFDYIQILCIHEYVDFSFTNVIFRCLEFLFKLSFVIDVIDQACFPFSFGAISDLLGHTGPINNI